MDIVKFRDKDGKMRTGVIGTCVICNSQYTTRVKRAEKQKCCSTKCSRQLRHINHTVEIECSQCKTKFRKRSGQLLNSKSGLYFCNRKCKDEAQKIGGIKEIMPPHYGTRESAYTLKDCESLGLEEKCVGCSEDKRYLLSLHHIDGNRENNIKTNLEIVCGNCHIKRHLDFVDNKWHLNFKKLTPRDKLKEL